jgi:hypothetical protein
MHLGKIQVQANYPGPLGDDSGSIFFSQSHNKGGKSVIF